MTLLSIFDAVEVMSGRCSQGRAKPRKLALEGLPIGGCAGIADEPFLG
jgi:hypothetical protein